MKIWATIKKLLNPSLSKNIETKREVYVSNTLNEVLTLARQRVVVWQGGLRRDLKIVRVSPTRGMVTNNLPYARKIHSTRPYLKDASDAIKPRWVARLNGLYGNVLSLPPMPTLERYPSIMAQKYGKYIKDS